MIPGKKYTPEDILAIALRRWWIIVVPFVIFASVAAAYAYSLPARWMSTAVISIVPQGIPETFVRSTVTIRVQDRLESIRRGILSRTRLEQIIEQFNLYPDLRKRLPMEDVVERMRTGDVRMSVAKGDAFEVSYSTGDPHLAQRVTERLANLFIEENIRQRATLAEGSSEFLKSQLEQVKQQLVATEKRLETFRRTNAGQLPDQVQTNLQGLTNVQMQLQLIAESINRDKDRRLMVDRQIDDLTQIPADGTSTVVSSGSGEIVAASSAIAQLEQAVSRLRALEIKLKPEHPDVLRMKRVVADLEAAAKAEVEHRAVPGASATRNTAAEISRRNRLRELQAEIGNLDRSIASKQSEETRLQALATSYQARIDAAPGRESDLTALMRDYDTVAQQYKSLLGNSKAAEMSEDLERRQGGEQFRLVDPARVPERPVSPNRPRLLAMGAAAGLALGLAVVGLLEFRDRSMRTEDDVLVALALPVIAIVPVMPTHHERRTHRRRVLAVAAATFLIVAAAGAAVGWRLFIH